MSELVGNLLWGTFAGDPSQRFIFLQSVESPLFLPWITVQRGCCCVSSASAQVEGTQLLVSLVPLPLIQRGTHCPGRVLADAGLDRLGTQGRGFLESEDPKEGVPTHPVLPGLQLGCVKLIRVQFAAETTC